MFHIPPKCVNVYHVHKITATFNKLAEVIQVPISVKCLGLNLANAIPSRKISIIFPLYDN